MSYLMVSSRAPRRGRGMSGWSDIFSSVLNPIATAGADIYRTRQDAKLTKRELQQRATEHAREAELAEQQLAIARAQLEAQERQHALEQQARLHESYYSQAMRSRYMPWIVGGAVLAALVFGGAAVAKRSRAKKQEGE